MTQETAFNVPAETFADHVILRPPNKLKERVARPADPAVRNIDPVRRAEHALSLLENEFDQWMDREVATLEHAREAAAAAPSAAAYDALYRAAHDIRGQGATLGFPLVGEIADGLCVMLEAYGETLPPQALVDRHVETIRAMVREDVRDHDHPLGVALARRLREMREKALPGLEGA